MEVPRDRLDLREDPELLSPPYLATPYTCARAVTVHGFVPGAQIQVEVAGIVVVDAPADFPLPNGHTFPVAPLPDAKPVRVRQRANGVWSDWSAPVTTRSHLVDYPAGPPRPEINPAPVYECGARTGVSNLLTGCTVWLTANGIEVGRVEGAADHQGINVAPDYGPAQDVSAFADLCGDPAPASATHKTQTPPSPLPTPAVDPATETAQQIRITNLVNGARFTLARSGVPTENHRTWGGSHLVTLNPPLSLSAPAQVVQTMCPGQPASPPGTGPVRPCSTLPAPIPAPVQDGDSTVTLVSFEPDAVIDVWVNGIPQGHGSGPTVYLKNPVPPGATIHVGQTVGDCKGKTVWETKAQCVAPRPAGNPAGLNLFPVGVLDYTGTPILFPPGPTAESLTVKGTVYYPAQADGVGTPFNARLAALGRVPVVFIAHGNHARFHDPANINNERCDNPGGWVEIPNHQGYDYFQRQLARLGVVAVSVYSNEANCRDFSITTIRRRAELILASVRRFQELDVGDPIFGGRLDFSRVGLLGHSQGAEAVVTVPEISPLPPGLSIRAVLALDPTDFGASSGTPHDYAFLTILPAGNGDVVQNFGAKFYDRAVPGPFKCQVYVHDANHNWFNRHWPGNDGVVSTIMPRTDHEAVLSAYGCAFFRAALLGHATTGYLEGRVLPTGTPVTNVHLSFEHEQQFTVDHHEDANGIGVNSLGRPTLQSGGLTAAEHPFAQMMPGRFNDSFFGNTTGMVAQTREANGTFRTELNAGVVLFGREIWVRVAEVFVSAPLSGGATGFQVGVEKASGVVVWVDSDEVGGLPRPFLRPSRMKTMLKTLRFPTRCFGLERDEEVRAILLRLNRSDQRNLAFDVLQIVTI